MSDNLKPIKEDNYFFKEQLKDCLYKNKLMIEENEFWLQFTEHIVIAISFFSLGMLVGAFIIYYVFNKRVRIDHEISKGTILRVKHEDKKWLIVRPKNFMQALDIMLLCVTDVNNDRYVDKHDKRRVRVIRIVLFTLLFFLVSIGILEILSAFAWSMNPLNYILQY